MGASWKTTISGLSAAGGTVALFFAGFILFASAPPYHVVFPTWLQAMAGYLASAGILGVGGGIASLGLNAKDSDVTGGTVSQPGIPVAPVPPVGLVAAVPVAPTPAAAKPAAKW